MAGDGDKGKANNERTVDRRGGERSASTRGEPEPHSRVGGAMECDHPPDPQLLLQQSSSLSPLPPLPPASTAPLLLLQQQQQQQQQSLPPGGGNNNKNNNNSSNNVINVNSTTISLNNYHRYTNNVNGVVARDNHHHHNNNNNNNNNHHRNARSFIEICQMRLLHLFPNLSPPPIRYSACKDSIESTAERLGNDVIRYLLKEDLYRVSKDGVSRSMRHNVHQMLNKHSILFTSMVNRLNVVPDTAYEAFMAVADELFYNGGITWARILCLYAFMGRLALWARDRRMYALKKKLPSYVSRYVSEEIAHFIKGYGGWEQLCIEYPVAEEVSGAVWRSLLMTGATLGLIATILTVAS